MPLKILEFIIREHIDIAICCVIHEMHEYIHCLRVDNDHLAHRAKPRSYSVCFSSSTSTSARLFDTRHKSRHPTRHSFDQRASLEQKAAPPNRSDQQQPTLPVMLKTGCWCSGNKNT